MSTDRKADIGERPPVWGSEELEVIRKTADERDIDTELEEFPIPPQKEHPRPSAADCILAAALDAALTAEIQDRLVGNEALAVVLRVATSSWVLPFETHLSARLGPRWVTIARDGSQRLHHKSEAGNGKVSAALTEGRSVLGIASTVRVLPASLVSAADYRIEVALPGADVLARAVQQFLGEASPPDLPPDVGAGLDFHDLIAAFRSAGSTVLNAGVPKC
jgi:cell division protease FtsH